MKHFKQLLLISSLLLVISTLSAQPFFQWNDSIKVTIGGTTLANPWAGGLNFIQASNIDLNGDGIKDLFMFDRTGNKIRTFINKGTVGVADYRYDPSYETLFPPGLHDWVLLVDYNNDGKEDIFTSTIGGMTVYRNTTTTSTGLQFTLMKNLLYSEYNPPSTSLTNLYVSSVDLPALSDIDNDGDLDIVTFEIGGNLMEYHKNMSMELYGTPDSLKFQMANRCWGYAQQDFAIGAGNYDLFDTCLGNVTAPEYKPEEIENKSADRHSGNCEICIDLDNDGDKDFIVGNVSYPSLTMLTNGGTPTHSSFSAKDLSFPANNASTAAVNLTLFPCAFYLDVNDDGIKDMLVSPNQTNACEDFNSVVYYKNTGTNTFPVFNYQQSNFLQDNMIEVGEGAYPIFFDYDNDGLKDLFIGNYGYYGAPNFTPGVAQFKNIGTATNPKFDLVTRDYANLSTVLAGVGILNFAPAFGDMDGDGDADMIIGLSDGKLQYFENTAAAGATANFVFASPDMKNSFGRAIDVGDFAAPQIYDVDGDGKNDLVIGSRNGKLSYYHHTGTGAIPVLDSITDVFGHVKTNMPGYVTGYTYPCLYKQGGVTNMLLGEESGYVRHYNNIDGNLGGTFTWADSTYDGTVTYEGIFQGNRTAPSMADIDNDGYIDLIVGNYEGGVSFYKGVSTLTTTNGIDNLIHFNFDLFPNPANNSFTVQILNLPAVRSGEENKTYQFELYDVMGQLMAKDKILNNTFSYSTSALAQGVYICKVSEINADGVKTTGALIKRIVVHH